MNRILGWFPHNTGYMLSSIIRGQPQKQNQLMPLAPDIDTLHKALLHNQTGRFAGGFTEWKSKFWQDRTTNNRLFGSLSGVVKLTAIRTV